MRPEKRISRRIPAKVIASCQTDDHVAGNRRKDFFFYTKDLSMHGARFVAPEKMQPGQSMSLHLELPTCFLPLVIHAKVAWVRKPVRFLPNNNKATEGGLRFLKMERCDRDKLNSFVHYKGGQAIEEKQDAIKTEKQEAAVQDRHLFVKLNDLLCLSLFDTLITC